MTRCNCGTEMLQRTHILEILIYSESKYIYLDKLFRGHFLSYFASTTITVGQCLRIWVETKDQMNEAILHRNTPMQTGLKVPFLGRKSEFLLLQLN